MNVCCDGVEYSLPLLVLGGKGPALLDRNWLEKIKLNRPIIKQLSSHNKRLEQICSRRGLELYKGERRKSMLTPRLPLSSIKPDQYRML